MTQSLFTSETPAVDGSDGAPGITTGTTFRATVDGTVTHIRFYTTATTGGTYTGLLWERTANDTSGGGTGSLLASKTYSGTPVGSSWNLIELDTPIAITAGTTYRVGVHNPTRYVATNNFFTGALTSGDLVADANGETGQHLGLIRQGSFLINASPGYPTQVGSSASYFIDVVFVADEVSASGTVAASLPALVAAASGSASSSGTVAAGLPALTSAAAGTASASGTVAASLPALVAAATGVMDIPETSSPTRALSTVSRSPSIATTTRARPVGSGSSPGGA